MADGMQHAGTEPEAVWKVVLTFSSPDVFRMLGRANATKSSYGEVDAEWDQSEHHQLDSVWRPEHIKKSRKGNVVEVIEWSDAAPWSSCWTGVHDAVSWTHTTKLNSSR